MNNLLKIIIPIIVYSLVTFSFAQEPTDCQNAIVVCGSSTIDLDVNGNGTFETTPNACQLVENNSIWLEINLITSGTLGFILTPDSNAITEDYDFAIYGPNADCNNLSQAIRCSTTNPQAANQGNNHTGINANENDFSEGPGQNGNSFVNWLDVNANEKYIILITRPHGNSGFSLEWTGTATFPDAPENQVNAGIPLDLELCDTVAPFNDNTTSFNLEENTSLILGSQTNVTITYHESESDAIIGENPLVSPYTNEFPNQTIFARIINEVSGCFVTTEFNLKVIPGPNIIQPTNIIECDDAIDGDDTNGFKIIDLSQKFDEILNGLDPINFNITFHLTLEDSELNINPLPLLFYNTIAFSQKIFVRVEEQSNDLCIGLVFFKIKINPLPESFNTTLLQCDEDGIPEGFTTFNLTQATNNLTGGVADRSVKLFTTLVDAQNTENEIDGNAFNNWFNPQIIYVRVVNDLNNCISSNIAELTLEVSTTNISDFQPTPLCDELGSEDGINSFNLSSVTTEIQDFNNIAFPVTFYENYIDALLEQDPLSASYTNTTPYNQIIYARVENNNNCYGIAEIQLTVFKLPQLEDDENLLYCLNEFPDSILTLSGGVINDDPSNYYYQWFFNNSMLNENEADITINEIGTYKVIVTTTEGCDKERIFTVEPSNIATFETIEITDASQNNTITIIVSGEGDYLYALDDENGIYQESNVFENVIAGFHTVYVKDVKNNCGIVDTLVSVIGFPKFFTPNGDSYNPTWHVHGVSEQFQPNTKIQIFNRFGKLVSVLSPLGPGWDGTFNGENMPADDYWFFVTLQDGRVFKNHFSLKR